MNRERYGSNMHETNSYYIDEKESISYYLGDNTRQIIEVIAKRYIGENPPLPYVFHAFSKAGFHCGSDGRFNLNLSDRLPDARLGQASYLVARLWKSEAANQGFQISCYGPVRVYLNGVLVFRSSVGEEVNIRNSKYFAAPCVKGWNDIIVCCIKTSSGFGCKMGVADAGWAWASFDTPFDERKGMKGFIYSETFEYEGDEAIRIPDITGVEKDTKLNWYPPYQWEENKEKIYPLERIFGKGHSKAVWCWSSVTTYGCKKEYEVRVKYGGSIQLWIDEKVLTVPKDGKKCTVELDSGRHDILVKSTCTDTTNWYYDVEIIRNGDILDYILPCPVQGTASKWLYLETNPEDSSMPQDITTMYKLFDNKGKKNYWCLDAPDMKVRPYLENDLFGKWNYPLGVTLYGLLQSARMLASKEIEKYVLAHINECISLYEYSLWDRKEYGYPEINNHISSMRTLDDCGSFGSAMLESLDSNTDKNYRTLAVSLADKIADYMKIHQERRPDGAFYRELKGIFCENTLWADDLYMSIPFLCRYYKMSGDEAYLHDAVKQFMLYKKYLYIPVYQVMSHVYDFKYNVATFIPWGRGNGWVLFSLSELLAVLPENHTGREEMLSFFNELCEGYLKLQGSNGLWHQLLTHPDAYEETSCTAMFIYGFARGIRYGWLRKDLHSYIDAVKKGWSGLTKKSVDKKGNIFGVCGGSAYSFTSEYYKKDLLTRLNDTHGIGIVMLAGIEVMKLKSF
jgi:rhamnogalacturonyl hydrolase YesR